MASPAPANLPASTPPQSSQSLVSFFALTFLLTWLLWLPVVYGWAPPDRLLGGALWLTGVFSPALAALLVTWLSSGTSGLRSLLQQVTTYPKTARLYLFAVTYMLAVKLVVAVVLRMSTGNWPAFGHERPLLIAIAVLLSTPFQIGEELGWRGYALPRLASRWGYGIGSIVLGLIWALWHLPQFYLQAADTYHQSFPLWSLQVTALSVAMAWLYQRAGNSVLITMLMHAAVNNTKDVVPSAAGPGKGVFSFSTSPVHYLTVALMCISAIYFFVQLRRDRAQPAPAK